MIHVDGLLDGDVAPVRDLDGARELRDDQEWRVVLVVNAELVLDWINLFNKSYSTCEEVN